MDSPLPRRILVLSAYHGGSHKYWLETIRDWFPTIDFHLLALEARNFSYTIRANPLEFYADLLQLHVEDFDGLLATSMVDLASLIGIDSRWARLPSILYFHENQFAYPPSPKAHRSIEPQMVQWYGAMAAGHLVFNSEYNRRSFFAGIEALSRRLPMTAKIDLQSMMAKSRVVPVPLREVQQKSQAPSSPLQILWNHRWEYDKGPDRLTKLIGVCEEVGLPVQFHIAGKKHTGNASEWQRLSKTFPKTVGGVYELGRPDYFALMARCHIVLSTALHDFQGLAMLEACQAGLCPLAPDRLAYPEYMGKEHLYSSYPKDPRKEAEACFEKLKAWCGDFETIPGAPNIKAYGGPILAPLYESLWKIFKSKED
jgi:glycosyltransferase involved in cell wall biosynthesis